MATAKKTSKPTAAKAVKTQAPSEPTAITTPVPAAAVILPTVGRKLYFQPARDILGGQHTAAGQIVQHADAELGERQPLDATILYVNGPNSIDIKVDDHVGKPHFLEFVPLVQDGDERPQGMHAYWMQFQVGQALKAT